MWKISHKADDNNGRVCGSDGDHNGGYFAAADDADGVMVFCASITLYAVTSFLVLWLDVDEAVQVVPGEMSQVSVQTQCIVIEALVGVSTQTVCHFNVFTPINAQHKNISLYHCNEWELWTEEKTRINWCTMVKMGANECWNPTDKTGTDFVIQIDTCSTTGICTSMKENVVKPRLFHNMTLHIRVHMWECIT
jgi:hypothetical protein